MPAIPPPDNDFVSFGKGVVSEVGVEDGGVFPESDDDTVADVKDDAVVAIEPELVNAFEFAVAIRALLSTIHHVGDSVAENLDGSLTSPVPGSIK